MCCLPPVSVSLLPAYFSFLNIAVGHFADLSSSNLLSEACEQFIDLALLVSIIARSLTSREVRVVSLNFAQTLPQAVLTSREKAELDFQLFELSLRVITLCDEERFSCQCFLPLF